jgi:hypothetical protein
MIVTRMKVLESACVQRGPAHQQAGEAAEAVEQRNHLGHRGHLTMRAAAPPMPAGTMPIATGIRRSLVEQAAHHSEQHADGGNQVAARAVAGELSIFRP